MTMMHTGLRYAFLLGTASAALCQASLATAQDATTRADTPPAPGALDDVTSEQTPEKRSLPLQSAQATGSDIVVTGSRIRGSAPVGSPVVAVGRQDLAEAGAINTNQLVQNLPQVTNQGISEGSRSASGGAGNITYASGFNIHGIGPFATLTLLNGRRIVQSGSSGGLPDPNTVPAIALQRVDVVADGASAIYGSDAVAGVVNLITRRRFSGLETNAHYGLAKDSHYNEWNLAAIAGHDWSSGNITIAGEYSGHAALNGRDRSFFAADLTGRGGGDYRGVQCAQPNLTINGVNYAGPNFAPNTLNRCDQLKGQDLIPSQSRVSAMASITQEIGSSVTLFGDLNYSRRTFAFQAADPALTVNVPNTNAFFRLPPGVAATSETVALSLAGQQRPNSSRGHSEVIQGTVGATVKLGGDWQLDASYTYGRDDSLSISDAGVNNGGLATALASSNPATAFNPFGPNDPALLAGLFNQVFAAPGINEEQQGSVTITGSLLDLPGGALRLAAGGEIIRDTIRTGLENGPVGATSRNLNTSGRTIKSVYAELLIPVFGPENATTGLRKLDISLAGRISDYSDVGSTRNPKIGVNWSPVEGLMLHGSYGKSFRAPVLTQINGAVNALFVQNYTTPNGVVTGAALSSLAGGNPLEPERARTFSFGADLALRSVPALRASVNYFDVRYTGQVNAILSDLSILQSPTTTAQYADRIVQGTAAAQLIRDFAAAGYPVFGVLPANPTLFVYGNNVNSGKTLARGIDFQLGYRLGAFNLGTNGTLFTRYDTAVSAVAPLQNVRNAIFYPPRFRARSSVRYNREAWDAALFWNFTDRYDNNRIVPTQKVDSYSTFDLHLARRFDTGGTGFASQVTFAIDVNNLFDRDPPLVDIPQSQNGGGGFDPTVTNPIGRLIAFTVSTKL
jgi:iron complex outermembrane receptor protein